MDVAGAFMRLMDVLRKLTSAVAQLIYRPTGSAAEEYHKWYYSNLVWNQTTWLGVQCWKSVSDMWNYQEILFDLKPSLVIEFGSRYGGSALFFANVMRHAGQPFKVVSVDISHKALDPIARRDPDILFIESSSTAQPLPSTSNDSKASTAAISSPSWTATTPWITYWPR